MYNDRIFFSTLKFLGASLLIIGTYMGYLCLLISIDDADRYSSCQDVMLSLQRSQDVISKATYDAIRAHQEYRDYIRQLEHT